MMTYRVVLTKNTHSQNTALSKNQGLFFQKAKRKNWFSMLHLIWVVYLKIYHYWRTLLPQLMNPLESLPSLKRSQKKQYIQIFSFQRKLGRKRHPTDRPWMTTNIKTAIRKRQSAFLPHGKESVIYKFWRNKLQRDISLVKRLLWKQSCWYWEN